MWRSELLLYGSEVDNDCLSCFFSNMHTVYTKVFETLESSEREKVSQEDTFVFLDTLLCHASAYFDFKFELLKEQETSIKTYVDWLTENFKTFCGGGSVWMPENVLFYKEDVLPQSTNKTDESDQQTYKLISLIQSFRTNLSSRRNTIPPTGLQTCLPLYEIKITKQMENDILIRNVGQDSFFLQGKKTSVCAVCAVLNSVFQYLRTNNLQKPITLTNVLTKKANSIMDRYYGSLLLVYGEKSQKSKRYLDDLFPDCFAYSYICAIRKKLIRLPYVKSFTKITAKELEYDFNYPIVTYLGDESNLIQLFNLFLHSEKRRTKNTFFILWLVKKFEKEEERRHAVMVNVSEREFVDSSSTENIKTNFNMLENITSHWETLEPEGKVSLEKVTRICFASVLSQEVVHHSLLSSPSSSRTGPAPPPLPQ